MPFRFGVFISIGILWLMISLGQYMTAAYVLWSALTALLVIPREFLSLSQIAMARPYHIDGDRVDVTVEGYIVHICYVRGFSRECVMRYGLCDEAAVVGLELGDEGVVAAG